MKASIKFRDEQKPLFRAKIPLNIIGFPFQSGIIAGESKELSLNLTSFFETGPTVKFAYRPNDSVNPFSLVFKTGIGHFGSPINSSFNMSAEFDLITSFQNPNPSFKVHFKPRLGDFSVKKTVKTERVVVKKQGDGGGDEHAPVIVDFESPVSGVVRGVVDDVEVAAVTSVALRRNAKVNFRWGVRVPPSEDDTAIVLMKNDNNSMAGISFEKLPFLFLNKIGIEHTGNGNSECRTVSKTGRKSVDVAEVFTGVKKQLDVVQGENVALRKALDNLRSEFSVVKNGSGKGKESELVKDAMKNNDLGVST
ncbi:hypothetical protein CTI12_AA521360 [Artemisia annua]|uniref:Uncharacterized protein n=1 Tax=Artemisia annua TaxID=35608 RepID=A0A2U1L7H8_ARTAN|nr:hypothetical protein CTI12_AA521360 [Artemisia annua]